MIRYRARFIGRKVFANGITYPIETIVESENEELARLKLYDNFEHIAKLELIELPEGENNGEG